MFHHVKTGLTELGSRRTQHMFEDSERTLKKKTQARHGGIRLNPSTEEAETGRALCELETSLVSGMVPCT